MFYFNKIQSATFFLLIYGFSFSSVSAKRICKAGSFCIDTRVINDQLHIELDNKKIFPFTFEFEVKLVDSRTTISKKYSFVVQGKSIKKLKAISTTALHGRWKYFYKYWYQPGSKLAQHDSAVDYLLPYAPGHKYKVAQAFNGKFSHFGYNQYSIDWKMDVGTKVHAARGGTVIEVITKFKKAGTTEYYKDKANRINILHEDQTIGNYLHLKFNGSKVVVGQKVYAGQEIGLSGHTGYSTTPHLHFFVTMPTSGRNAVSIPIKYQTKKLKGATLEQGKYYVAREIESAKKNIREDENIDTENIDTENIPDSSLPNPFQPVSRD